MEAAYWPQSDVMRLREQPDKAIFPMYFDEITGSEQPLVNLHYKKNMNKWKIIGKDMGNKTLTCSSTSIEKSKNVEKKSLSLNKIGILPQEIVDMIKNYLFYTKEQLIFRTLRTYLHVDIVGMQITRQPFLGEMEMQTYEYMTIRTSEMNPMSDPLTRSHITCITCGNFTDEYLYWGGYSENMLCRCQDNPDIQMQNNLQVFSWGQVIINDREGTDGIIAVSNYDNEEDSDCDTVYAYDDGYDSW
jgi:hypothetical protein